MTQLSLFTGMPKDPRSGFSLTVSAGFPVSPTFQFDANSVNFTDGTALTSIQSTTGGLTATTSAANTAATLQRSDIDGRKVFRFAGNQDFLISGLSLDPQNFTLVMVCELENFLGGSGNSQNILASFGGVAARNYFYNWGAASFFDGATKGGYGGTFSKGTFNILILEGNASNLILRANGVELFNSAALAAGDTITSLRIGRNNNFVQSFIGDIAYVAAFSSALGATNRQILDDSLRKRIPEKRLRADIFNAVAIGNSLTEGTGAPSRDTRWFEVAISAAALTPQARENFVSRGYAGITTGGLNTSRNAIFMSDIPASGQNNVTFVWELTNSINTVQDGPGAYAQLTALCSNIKVSKPFTRTVAMTMLPRGTSTSVESARLVVNACVRAGAVSVSGVPYLLSKGTDSIDFVYDIAGIPTIGSAGVQTSTAFYLADQVHLNSAGHHVAGSLAGPVLTHLFNNPL